METCWSRFLVAFSHVATRPKAFSEGTAACLQLQYFIMRIDPKMDTSSTPSINTWVLIRTILLRRSLLFKKRPCEPTYWVHGKHIRRREIGESQKVKCRSRKEEAVYTYAVRILQQWLLEPVTHEIWETAALNSTIYSTAREKEKKDGESSHTIYTPGQSWYYYFFSLVKKEFCNALVITVAPEKVPQFGNARLIHR